jgi:hypothetical protein
MIQNLKPDSATQQIQGRQKLDSSDSTSHNDPDDLENNSDRAA